MNNELKGVLEDNSFNVIVQITESGPKGEKGDKGESAYEHWLSLGNVGTIDDFLLTLKGDKGDKGDPGYTPIKGIDYFDGSDANVTYTNVVNALGYIPLSEDSLPSNLETPAGAQAKADAAETNAKNHANSLVGTLSNLLTTAKNNVVAAINEIFGKVEDVEGDLESHQADEATIGKLGHVYHATLTTTLDTTWTGTEPPYTKTQTVTGISSNDNPIVDVVMSGTFTTDVERANEWSKIYRITTADNSITLYATDKPTVSLPIQLKVVR